ncbi:hypothetical protein HY410_01010 [Candidatus Gottesmanbacteria bacterium]|nr:hypothetical protein [Candidatus Gottesmanbacteria bacterium]
MVSVLTHAFLPHHTNNHRARALHIDAYLVYIFAFLMFQIVTWVGSMRIPDVLGYATDIRLEELLSLTNAKRQEAGLSPLSLNGQLSQAAAGKAADMFAKAYWAHTSPDGKLPWDFIVGAGYTYTVAGENLAKNFNDSRGVVDAWMASATHKENLLKPSYKDIGFAIVNGTLNGEETTLVVQMFGTSAGAPVGVVTTPAPFVPAAVAQEPTTVPKTLAPVPSPVVVTQFGFTTEEPAQPVPVILAQFQQVIKHPWVNLSSLNKWVSFLFIGFLLIVLSLDAWLVHRRRIVRVSGRSHAHILFFTALLVIIGMSLPGSIL